MIAASQVPAFDPDSADACILAAYERVRAHRVYAYSFDGVHVDPVREAEIAAADERIYEDEKQVYDNVANTLPGVIARLTLLIPSLDNDRWVDRDLMEHGFLALYRSVGRIDGHAQQVAYAIRELLDIEWEQALGAYERSVDDFDYALNLKGIVDRIPVPAADNPLSTFFHAASALGDVLEERFSNEGQIKTLVRTLVPDQAAYRRKAEIVMRENYQEWAAEWLVRDALFLLGNAHRDDVAQTEA
uniref:hypothetical protein n=1 Tax=uncultured Sphingomonas sp. TaxID=158754 RepID=UPI0035CBFBA7